ncbi:MAG: hypothetical protein ACRELB_16625 [Polyangiaceae bacterium]
MKPVGVKQLGCPGGGWRGRWLAAMPGDEGRMGREAVSPEATALVSEAQQRHALGQRAGRSQFLPKSR